MNFSRYTDYKDIVIWIISLCQLDRNYKYENGINCCREFVLFISLMLIIMQFSSRRSQGVGAVLPGFFFLNTVRNALF